MPAALELHENVALPGEERLVGLIVPQVRPDGIVSVRVTVPVKPLIEPIVIVDAELVPMGTAPGADAARVKSDTLIPMVVE